MRSGNGGGSGSGKDGGIGLAPMRDRYIELLESRVVNPLTRDLNTLLDKLERRMSRLSKDSTDYKIMRKGLRSEISKVGRAIRGVKAEFRRAKSLKLRHAKS
jgi:hypothetical protein